MSENIPECPRCFNNRNAEQCGSDIGAFYCLGCGDWYNETPLRGRKLFEKLTRLRARIPNLSDEDIQIFEARLP